MNREDLKQLKEQVPVSRGLILRKSLIKWVVDYLQQHVEDFKGEQGVQGASGADGRSPVRGEDYWTEADQKSVMQESIAEVSKHVKDGKDGRDGIEGKTPVKGEDYWTDKELQQISTEIQEKVSIGFPSITEVQEAIAKSTDWVVSWVKSAYKPESIRDALVKLKGDKRLPASAVKDWKKEVQSLVVSVGGGGEGGSSLTIATAAEILLSTGSEGDTAFASDTHDMYVYNGAWVVVGSADYNKRYNFMISGR